jgi:hypothetical protein
MNNAAIFKPIKFQSRRIRQRRPFDKRSFRDWELA